MDKTNLEYALEYAARGWAVFPLKERDKSPITDHGFKDATTNRAIIEQWWTQSPNANVAIATGQVSGGLVVIDLDVHEETGESGIDTLNEWESENGCLPDTWRTITGRGGNHIFFLSDVPIRNRTNCHPCIDIRGDGGYIVAPPSIHPNGNRYEWEWYEGDCDLANIKDDEASEYFFACLDDKPADNTHTSKIDFTVKTTKGGRNTMLHKYASSLQGQGFSDDDIKDMCSVYNATRLDPPLSQYEVERTVASVLSRTEWKGDAKKKEKPKEANEKIKELQHLRSATDLMAENLPELRTIVGIDDDVPLLVEGTCILSAKSKLGKSWLMLEMCDAITKGKDFLGYKTLKGSALYLDLETKKNLKQKRLNKLKNIVGNIAPTFYIQDTALPLADGLEEEIDNYMTEDPNICVIVIDVLQKVLKPKPNNVTDYEYYYDKIGIFNKISEKYHVSIILICHDRKTVDVTDPFANILGSTALQGATDQMIVMYKAKYNAPVTKIIAKGRTIDGLAEIEACMDNGMWKKANNVMQLNKVDEYKQTDIYKGLIALLKNSGTWKGRCNQFVSDCNDIGIAIDLPKDSNGKTDFRRVGATFSDVCFHELLKESHITAQPIKNGEGSKIYRFTVDTVDEWETTVDEIPF